MQPTRTSGMNHIGFTVPDIDQAIHFFEQVLECRCVFRTGPFDQVDNTFMVRHLAAKNGARIRDLAMLRCGDGTNLEVFQYESPDPAGEYLAPSQLGAYHLAFQVEDVARAVARLRDLGVETYEGPNYVDEGPFEGLTWSYFRAPWGQYLELFSYDSLGYEANSEDRIWKP